MNKKSFIFYFLCLGVFVLLVQQKQKTIRKKNEKEPITFYSAWKREGKPVLVKEVQKSDMNASLKITLSRESENIYLGYLPKAQMKGLSLDTPVFIQLKDKKISCRILKIGERVQFDTGMYPIKIFCSEKLSEADTNYLAEIAISGLKNVVIVPHGSINMEDERTFVWVIKEGKAHKQFITLEGRSRKGVVARGVEEKDLIIVRSSASIRENDFVKLNYEN